MSSPTTVEGITCAYCVVMSALPSARNCAMRLRARSRTNGSRPATRDGVRTRASTDRSWSWRGGSMLNMFVGSWLLSVPTSTPRADENVRQSDIAGSMSA